ncbi:MAG: hypothetical protein ABIH46_13135 [Chloroflexota bacterium]
MIQMQSPARTIVAPIIAAIWLGASPTSRAATSSTITIATARQMKAAMRG